MLGVEVAVAVVTCVVAILLLLTSPIWMRALTAIVAALWRQVAQTDREVIVRDSAKDVVDGEFREVEK
ncbi:MAG TPA: hypothetical protein VFD70_25580 [Anaerolineae bacterium]|nr:hypothetical protein [Anaerolineae bacterium]